MKRKVVEIDAKSSRKERGLGDAPVLGRVAKVSDTDNPVQIGYDQAEDEERDEEAGEWLIKLGMISALLIGLIVGGAVIYFTAVSKIRDGQMASSDKQRPETPANGNTDEGAREMIREKEALDLVRRGLAVRYASNVTEYFRYTPTLEAPVVIEFLKSLSDTDGLVVSMEWLEPLARDGVDMARVRIHFSSIQGAGSRDAYLLQSSESEWRIDYDSFAKGQEPVVELPQQDLSEDP